MTIAAQIIPDEEIEAMIEKNGMENAFQVWLKTRPKNVQDFAAKHIDLRPGTIIEASGEKYWFLGYGEHEYGGVGLIVTAIDPSEDYDRAVEERQHICADYLA